MIAVEFGESTLDGCGRCDDWALTVAGMACVIAYIRESPTLSVCESVALEMPLSFDNATTMPLSYIPGLVPLFHPVRRVHCLPCEMPGESQVKRREN